ncbi:MAG TPA: glycosyltransferase family 1 protein [Bryobacteraceae bacterium]|nr:glycosyltransferase family 1 protein [Bryobacteraceae bacterium]
MRKIGKDEGASVSLLLDASPLLLRSAGVKNYVYYWVRSLAEHAGANRLELFPFLRGLGTFAHEKSVLSHAATLPRLGLLYAANICPFPFLNWLTPASDIFHASHQVLHPPRKARMTSTIYDMTCWLMPEVHAAANVKAADRIANGVFRPAQGLIAISECTRADAVRVLNLPPEKIEVIYPGIAPAFFDVDADAARETARRYSLVKPYALYVGSIEPRKNVATMLDAWLDLPGDVREEFDLVVIGPWGWGDRTVYDRLQAGIAGVRYLGYVPEPDLPALTAAATIFVYLSLYEGFGLPVGQAMAAGVPVVASLASALPEVVGDAGLLADPRSRAEIRGGMERLLLSPSLRAQLTERGKKRAAAFTWDECARKSWKFFERVAGHD